MSYVDPHRSGTTFGVVDFNDVFAPNTSYNWDTLADDLDTLICKVPYDDTLGNPLNAYHLLTAYRDGTNTLHWYGPGIYLCCNVSGSSVQMGDAVCISNTAAASPTNSRPVIEIGTTTTDTDNPFGVVLEPIADQGYGSVAMAGIFPAKRGSNVLSFEQHIYIDNSPSGVVRSSATNDRGAIGRTIQPDFPIITDALGTTVNGGLILMWGTSRELF